MGEREFLEMRIGTFFLKLHFYLRKRDEENRLSAELVRYQTWHLINIQLAQSDKIKQPSDFWKFKWEEKEEGENKSTEEISLQEADKQLQRLLKLHNKK